MSVEQQAGLLLVCMQGQQFQIAADAARLVLQRHRRRSETLFLFCLHAVRAVLERRGSAVRTPWKCGANTKSAAQTQ